MSRAPASAAGSVPRELRPWIAEDDSPVIHTRPSFWAVPIASVRPATVVALFGALATLVLAAAGRFDPRVLLAVGVGLLLVLVWNAVVMHFRRYAITSRYVLRVSGVFARSAANLPVERVQHVAMHRSLLERLTGTGTLGFATAGTGSIEIAWVTIARPLERLGEVRAVLEHRPDASSEAIAPPLIGISGGIGAGKSAVAASFAKLGCLVADSDAAAREALQRPDVRDQLVEWWGDGVLDDAGRVSRSEVAHIVFADEGERRRLERLIHPIVREGRAALVERARKAGAPAVILDAPLLFEAGLDAECDMVVFVHTPREVRLERVRETRGWDEAELDRREKVQLPLDEKRDRSDDEIVNDADPDRLDAVVRRTLERILANRTAGDAGPKGPRARE